MGDRRKPGSAEERHIETDRQFLDQANVKPLMRDVLGKLLANRPEDPLAFIAHYFESLDDKSSLVTKAYIQVTLTHHSRPAFHRNLKAAYNLLSEHKVKKSLKGVSGSVYADLLIMLLREIPTTITNKLMKKIECMEFEAVTFSHFQSGVFTCCVLQDYVKLTTELFKSLDIQESGWLDKNLSQVVLDQLTKALSQSKHQNSLSILESAHRLGPDGLYEAIEQAYRYNPKKQGTVNLEDFTAKACDAFLLKIKPLR